MKPVYECPRNENAIGQTHFLIIGVGHYPHLPGGAEPRGPEVADGMEQLDSPPRSARAFADWCITTFENPLRPIGSVRLLISDGSAQTYQVPGGTKVEVGCATVPNIRTAALKLKEIGDAHPNDTLVFFFSGHGMSSGSRYSLLAQDYGEIVERPLLGAVGFDGFLTGMKSCHATHQVYFIDACRVSSGVLLANRCETGDVLVPSSKPWTQAEQSVFFASLGGRPAFGRDGDVSLFTRALLKSLRGPGAANPLGDWRINTTRLQEALHHFASRLADPENGKVQSPQSGTQSTFDFHYFTKVSPVVPVYVRPAWHSGDEPPEDALSISVSYGGFEIVSWAQPWAPCDSCRWQPNRFESWVIPGRQYTVALRHSGNDKPIEACDYISPPYRLIRICHDG